MADISDINSAQTVKVVGSDATGVEQTPVQSTASGGLHSNLRNQSGQELLGRQLPSNSIPSVKSEAETFSATINSLVTPASATDIFTITGSASKIIRVTKIHVSGNQTTHSWRTFKGLKRSTANSGGTSTVITAVPHDSLNSAATATVRAYTGNPTLGTLIGELRAERMSLPVTTPTNAQGNGPGTRLSWDFAQEGQPIILRGVNEVFALNLNSVSLAGPSLDIFIEWTEE